MLSLQKAFSQLRLVVSSAADTAVRCSACAQSASYSTKKGESEKVQTYEPPSPYRNPGPRRYGYEPRFFTGGLLPRGEDLKGVRSLPKYKPKDSWDRKRALFGQNDYIDILGNGSIKPADLIRGPDWLIGFKGNELQRLVRRMNFHGDKLKHLYPSKYHSMQKRIFFLHKKYNKKRGKRVGGE